MIRTIVIAALLFGCAAPQKDRVWVKTDGGGSQQELLQADGQCKAQAFSVPGAPMMQVAIVYNTCMQGRGWYQKEQ